MIGPARGSVARRLAGLRERIAALALGFGRQVPPGRVSAFLPLTQATDAELERLCLEAAGWIRAAASVSMRELSARVVSGPRWPDIWPGEHYRLLAGMVTVLKPRRIVEIGTYTGLSALAMRQQLEPGAEIVTFDVVPWRSLQNTCLRDEDFAAGDFRQVLADLARAGDFRTHEGLLRGAHIIFIDGPKDGVFEPTFLALLSATHFERAPLLVLDDIRFPNMVPLWERISAPKLDLSSFGHWSGTGVVRWRTGALG
ncbi:MAG: methyltransferase [Burkholderiales bacterium]|nr:methyltransferase [Burkholderiales bacterium]